MVRLHCIAEGLTEKNFVQRTLSPLFAMQNIFIDVTCVLTSKDLRYGKQYKGGLSTYTKAKNHIQAWLKQDSNTDVRFTTMFDLYGLPGDFPGYDESKKINNPYDRVKFLEEKFKEDISDTRFFPYIQLYEFEALIFVDPGKLADEYFNIDAEIQNLRIMRSNAKDQNPECINDSPDSSPSKRILKLIPDYDKSNIGPLIAEKIGLKRLRTECKHFGSWISQIENLTNQDQNKCSI